MALAHGVISQDTTVFDYGCGKGDDLRYLKKRGIPCSGWDPAFRPNEPITRADVVNLGYVLNVIEDPAERREVLDRAFNLAATVLIVAVRVDRALEGTEEWGDGFLTNSGTFQKIFEQLEFREFLEEVTGLRPYVADLGIAYLFKSSEAEAAYLARRAYARRLEYRTELIEEFSRDRTARSYVRLANKLGRLPLPEEFPKFPVLLDAFGSAERVKRLALTLVDTDKLAEARTQRREDVLTFLASLRLQNVTPPPLATLAPSVRGDVKAFWRSYRTALEEAQRFLFRLGDEEAVTQACASATVGKLLPDALYVHHSAEEDLPALLRVLLDAARCIVGDIDHNVVKLATNGRAVSFLAYQDFDEDPHPRLRYAVRVNLPRATYKIRNYTRSANPPILHRKDALVAPSYPHFEEFRALTLQEESHGLLERPDIGHARGWAEVLKTSQLYIEGHRLLPLRTGQGT